MASRTTILIVWFSKTGVGGRPGNGKGVWTAVLQALTHFPSSLLCSGWATTATITRKRALAAFVPNMSVLTFTGISCFDLHHVANRWTLSQRKWRSKKLIITLKASWIRARRRYKKSVKQTVPNMKFGLDSLLPAAYLCGSFRSWRSRGSP